MWLRKRNIAEHIIKNNAVEFFKMVKEKRRTIIVIF
jgi:hypothetical protein